MITFYGRVTMATISDIAKAAGVSIATVSRVLSKPDVVKSATRQRVMEVVDRMGYQPNALAQQLRMQETKNILVIIPSMENYMAHKVIRGVEQAADANGYHTLIADMHDQDSIEDYYMNAIQKRQADGIISLSTSMAQKLSSLEGAASFPIVIALHDPDKSKIPCVTIDHSAAARAAMTHLIRLGHKKIAHITSSQKITPYLRRIDSYREVLLENQLPFAPELIRFGESSLQSGYEMTESLLSSGNNFTAIFAAGDTMALGAMKALKAHGIRVPQDCAVVGFDDIELAAYWDPALTTVRIPMEQLGQRAFAKLLAQIKGEPILIEKEVLPHELVIRESCGYLM